MTRPKRNDRCPCGSGKKYKKCCGQAVSAQFNLPHVRGTSQLRFDLDQSTNQLLAQAFSAYAIGLFADGFEICREIVSRAEVPRTASQLLFLNAINFFGYRSGPDSPIHAPSTRIEHHIEEVDSSGVPAVEFYRYPEDLSVQQSIAQILSSSIFENVRSAYPVEALLLNLSEGNLSDDHINHAIERLRQRIADNLWIIPSDHPTAVLNVARWCVDRRRYIDFARSLVNCCLGWRYPFRRIDDLISLAELLNYFKAPRFMWDSLLSSYVDFAGDDSLNQQTLVDAGIMSKIVETRRLLVDVKEGMFHQFCAEHGLPNHNVLLRLLLDSMGIKINESAKRFQGDGLYSPGPYEEWASPDAFQMRHPWFVLLSPHERDFVRNGDTAFATCLTNDFSFGCAQWWRCVESVLRRRLVEPLGCLIDAHPAWVAEDESYARQLTSKKDWEEVFVKILPNTQRRQKLSLTKMLWLLQSCMADIATKKRSKSVIRAKCVEFISNNLEDYRWANGELDNVADFRSIMTTPVLNEVTINSFRNAASHDAPMDYEHAAVGRLLAIRVLDYMHYPRYCVNEKVEELKHELSVRSKSTAEQIAQ